MEEEHVHKQHNAPKSGAKAKKKAQKLQKVASAKGKSGQSSDPRAFSIQKVNKIRRRVMHALDKETRKHHAPIANRTADQPPPLVIAVVGPPQVGKTTLIRSLVKRFTKQTLNEIKGPITIVAGKNRRYTFIECKNDMNAMLDLAKICDVALLMVDGSFGFEMETFEFLNMLMAHGMPRVMGVLTQLDRLRTQKQIRRRKKELKARFQSEISARSNLFYFSGISKDMYPQRETVNMARFLSVLKPKVQRWRNNHPYILADRLEDITDPEDVRVNPKMDRSISIYGYVRGTYIRSGQRVHMPGGGDFTLDNVTLLKDPCPAPSSKEEMTKSRKRRLDDRDRVVYAPMSDVGGILFDRDATYIEMPEDEDEEEEGDEDEDEDEDKAGDRAMKEDEDAEPDFRDVGDDDGDAEDGGVGGARWKEGMLERASKHHETRHAANLHELVYGKRASQTVDADDDDNDGDDFFTMRSKAKADEVHDSSRGAWSTAIDHDWDEEDLIAELKNQFVTGEWHEDDDAQTLLDKHKQSLEQGDSDGDGDGAEDDEFGDFEDLETGEVHTSSSAAAAGGEGEMGDADADGEGEGDEGEDEEEQPKSALTSRQKRELKKARMKALFDEEYDRVSGGGKTHFDEVKDELAERVKFNMDEFADEDDTLRVEYEGYRPGLYVRVEVHGVPMELVEYFDASYPYILGGVLPQEEEMGFIQIRFKRHRFYQRRLKNRDPVIMSMGWRRFQTTPLYASQDDNHRHRLLKVTPDHVHCVACVYAPFVDPGSGCLTVINSGEAGTDFRVTGTGTVVQLDQTSDIVKKLKLVGYPMKVVKNTAFIKGMFNSALEVAKFQGAAIKTVSGIRGQIKRAIRAPDGAFRATFEDRILMSDIIFLRTWYPVTPPKFYNPVLSLLLPDKTAWGGMRSTWVLRIANGLPTPRKKDSEYRPIHRKERRFNPLKVPKKLQANLPFKTKPKLATKRRHATYETKRAVVLSEKERKRISLLQELATIRNDMNAKKKARRAQKREEAKKKYVKSELERTRIRKEKMKEVYRALGKEEKRRMIAQGRALPDSKRAKGPEPV
ncbi:hypothetical protein PTSG_11309 [Salpingoeca rosetta]|uniref:Bms1-type G domain-containing protein n=1 Tax=Salpingoeca rosetta (strain ATCC 50818 / BSB-021) TaxID=946362 RepID=F2UT13_SALR5|nr:uncharacterized protein PTSG_11309 [Salpingoeca rosetta]EGD81272.1 hypothetical protein PTSG_11309 [Salpingoeca rosetta]|eukprot:XP_004987668.1 hypothetical protein PTSG_11309 [Salpingoeca rosetta]